MGRNNICVIYDSDENYAKRLMSVINDDNDIPYNAQVFTKEHELDKYLQEKEADMLMICEGAYALYPYAPSHIISISASFSCRYLSSSCSLVKTCAL